MYVKMIKIREEIHQLFVEYLLDKSSNHLINKIEETLISDTFENNMINLAKEKKFKTQDIFKLHEKCFLAISDLIR